MVFVPLSKFSWMTFFFSSSYVVWRCDLSGILPYGRRPVPIELFTFQYGDFTHE